MKTASVVFDEPLHHVCLMYGVRRTFERMPFLNRRVLETGGKIYMKNNITVPPPMMKNPVRASRIGVRKNLVEVSYWKDTVCIEYREDICSTAEIADFVHNLIEGYLHFRHPFMKIEIKEGKCKEILTGHIIAEIL